MNQEVVLALFCLTFIQLEAANISQIELKLGTAFELLINEELKISSLISNCNSVAGTAIKNLNASNISSDFIASFGDFVAIANNLQMIKNFEKFVPCGNVTDCDCQNYRIAMCGVDIEKMEDLIDIAVENFTIFYNSRSNILRQFERNFQPLQNLWTKEVLVVTFLNKSFAVLNEFGKYFQLLNTVKNFLINMKDYLTADLATLNCSTENTTFQTTGDQIDVDLRNSEQKLINLTFIAWNFVNISLNNSSSAAQKIPLQALSKVLQDISSADDYSPEVTWPKIPDTKGASYATIKIRCCQAKKASYEYTANYAAKNQSRIRNGLDDLKKVSGVTSTRLNKRSAEDPEIRETYVERSLRKPDEVKKYLENNAVNPDNISKTLRTKRTISSDVSNVINSVSKVANFYTSYINQLNLAATKIDIFSQSFSLQVCDVTQDVFTASAYLKTACRINQNLNNQQAQDFCSSIGMKLFQITTVDEYIAALQASIGFFGPSASADVLIDGYQASNGTWFVGDKLFYITSPLTVNGGRCLKLTARLTQITTGNTPCTTSMNSICEFVRTAGVNRVPIASICRNSTVILDSNSNYFKTACIIDISGNLEVAKALCRMNGMNTFNIKNARDYNAIKTMAVNSFATSQSFYTGGSLVNGKWMTAGVPLYSGAIPTSVTGDCLIFRTTDTIGGECTPSYRPICEFF